MSNARIGKFDPADQAGAGPESGEFVGTQRFAIRRKLGAGGMGVVYEAYDRERDMAVALKTLRHTDAQSIYRLKAEFRAIADVEHRNLVRLGELFHEADAWFFTMELVPGQAFLPWVQGARASDAVQAVTYGDTLDAVTPWPTTLGPAPGFDEGRLRDALGQLVLGVSALHAAGKVHRDIKPSNVLVTPKGRVVLLDMGLCAEVDDPSSDSNVVGTAGYMAPEQAQTPTPVSASDWYSVGVMLFEALTGRLPFTGAPLELLMRKQREAAPRPSHLADDVPDDLDALCARLLERDPLKRPNGEEIARILQLQSEVPTQAVSSFVGRNHELGSLHDALEEVERGGPLSLFVRGESGIGKTALVRRFLDRLGEHRPDVLVLSARCYERESMPFKAIDGLVDELTRELCRRDRLDVAMVLPPDTGTLARLFPVLMRVPAVARLGVPKVKSPLEQRSRAFLALRALLIRLAEKSPVVLSIDDYQWADADSLALLEEVLLPPGAPRVLLVATRRGGGAGEAETRALPGVSRELVLLGLSRDESRTLAGILAGGEASPVADEADGHPLFIHELVRHQAAGGMTRLDDALGARVARLEEAALRVLEATCVAGAPIAQNAIAHAAELEPAACSKRVAQLRAAMLVRTTGLRGGDSIEVYHDRVRQTVLARLDEARRRRYHELLAGALEAGGGARKDPLALVRHLVAAGAAERAAELARRAGLLAAETLAFDQAAELYRMALFLGGGEPVERRQLAMRHAEALANAGRGPEAAEAFLAAAIHATDGAERFRCRHRAAEQFLCSGHIERGMATLGSVLAEVGVVMPATPAATRRSLVASWLKLALRGRRWKPRETSSVPARDLMRLEVYSSIALGVAMVDNALGADFQARALRLALDVGDPRRIAQALAFHAIYQGTRGGPSLSRAWRTFAESRRLADSLGEAWLLAWTSSAHGILCYFSGRFAEACEHFAVAEAHLRDHTVGAQSELVHTRVFEMFALRRMGDFHALGRRYKDYVRDAARRGDRYAETTFIRSANLLWLAADDVATARAELARTRWSPREGGYHLQHWFEARALVDLALYEGSPLPEVATRNLEAFQRTPLVRLQVLRAEHDWMRARLALVDGELGEARRLLVRLRREKIAYIEVWAELVAGGLGDPAAYERAAQTADGTDMPLFAAIARFRLGQLTSGEAGQALVAFARARLEDLGVRNAEAMARVIAPTVTGEVRLARRARTA